VKKKKKSDYVFETVVHEQYTSDRCFHFFLIERIAIVLVATITIKYNQLFMFAQLTKTFSNYLPVNNNNNKKKRARDDENEQQQNTITPTTTEWAAREFHTLIVHEIERRFQESFDVDISICEYPLVTTVPFNGRSFDCELPGECRSTSSPDKSASVLVLHPQLLDKSLRLQNLHDNAPTVQRADLLTTWDVIGEGGFGVVANLPRLHSSGPPLVVKLQKMNNDIRLLSTPLVQDDLLDASAVATPFASIIEAVTLYALNRYEQTIGSFLPTQPEGCVPRIFYTACVRQRDVLYQAIVMEQITDAKALVYDFIENVEKDNELQREQQREFLTYNLRQFQFIMRNMEQSTLRLWNFDANTRNMLVVVPSSSTFAEKEESSLFWWPLYKKKAIQSTLSLSARQAQEDKARQQRVTSDYRKNKFYLVDYGYVFVSLPVSWICVPNSASKQLMQKKCRQNSIAFKFSHVVPHNNEHLKGMYGIASTFADSERFPPGSYQHELYTQPETYGVYKEDMYIATTLGPSIYTSQDQSAVYGSDKLPACMTILPSPCASSLGDAAQQIVNVYDMNKLKDSPTSGYRFRNKQVSPIPVVVDNDDENDEKNGNKNEQLPLKRQALFNSRNKNFDVLMPYSRQQHVHFAALVPDKEARDAMRHDIAYRHFRESYDFSFDDPFVEQDPYAQQQRYLAYDVKYVYYDPNQANDGGDVVVQQQKTIWNLPFL